MHRLSPSDAHTSSSIHKENTKKDNSKHRGGIEINDPNRGMFSGVIVQTYQAGSAYSSINITETGTRGMSLEQAATLTRISVSGECCTHHPLKILLEQRFTELC